MYAKPRKCANCGELTLPSKPRVRRVFCSLRCQCEGTRGIKHQNYKGGWIDWSRTSRPFRRISITNSVGCHRAVYLHRYLVGLHLGRELRQSEVVYHLNEDTLDNRLVNLYVYDSSSAFMKDRGRGVLPTVTNLPDVVG